MRIFVFLQFLAQFKFAVKTSKTTPTSFLILYISYFIKFSVRSPLQGDFELRYASTTLPRVAPRLCSASKNNRGPIKIGLCVQFETATRDPSGVS